MIFSLLLDLQISIPHRLFYLFWSHCIFYFTFNLNSTYLLLFTFSFYLFFSPPFSYFFHQMTSADIQPKPSRQHQYTHTSHLPFVPISPLSPHLCLYISTFYFLFSYVFLLQSFKLKNLPLFWSLFPYCPLHMVLAQDSLHIDRRPCSPSALAGWRGFETQVKAVHCVQSRLASTVYSVLRLITVHNILC